MSDTPSEVALSELDPILGPVLAYSSGSAESRVLALLTKGLDRAAPLSPEAIRLWIRSRCVDGYMFGSATDAIGGRHGTHEPRGHSRSRRSRDIAYEMRSLAKSEGWGQLVASARERVISSSGDGRDVRGASLDIALRTVAGVLMELPSTGNAVQVRTNVGARAALALIGMVALKDNRGWDSVIMSFARGAAELGVDWRAVASWTKLLEERGVVTRPRAQAFVASRFRVKKLSGKRLKRARQWEGAAAALVDEVAEPIAMVLRSVTHPAWTYSDKIGLMHWALLLATTAGVPPEAFGIRPKVQRRLRTELTSEYELGPAVVVPYLGEILDRLADDIAYGTTDKNTGERITARVAKERAMAAYAEQAAVNKAAAEAATEMKKEGYATVAKLLVQYPIPKHPFEGKTSTRDKRQKESLAWGEALHTLVMNGNPSAEWRQMVARPLTGSLVKARYPKAFAEALVGYILSSEPDVTLETWLSQASADDSPSRPSRRRG